MTYAVGSNGTIVTEQFGKQGYHIAYLISETLKRGAAVIEPSREAQDAYVRHFQDMELDLSAFQRQCPPSYFNNEGEAKAKWALFRVYGPGWDAFQKLLQVWRDKGDMEGLVVGYESSSAPSSFRQRNVG